MSPAVADRLAGFQIQILVEGKGHFLFGRESCIALVERTSEGFGSIGSTGFMTDHGLAYLVWQERAAKLVAKGHETTAEPAQVEQIRRFSEDLKSALGL